MGRLGQCAIANGCDEGFIQLLFDDSPVAHGNGRIFGGGMIGTHVGDMICEIALAIEMGADSVDLGKSIHAKATAWQRSGARVLYGCAVSASLRRTTDAWYLLGALKQKRQSLDCFFIASIIILIAGCSCLVSAREGFCSQLFLMSH